jgi:hypothetical protein
MINDRSVRIFAPEANGELIGKGCTDGYADAGGAASASSRAANLAAPAADRAGASVGSGDNDRCIESATVVEATEVRQMVGGDHRNCRCGNPHSFGHRGRDDERKEAFDSGCSCPGITGDISSCHHSGSNRSDDPGPNSSSNRRTDRRAYHRAACCRGIPSRLHRNPTRKKG